MTNFAAGKAAFSSRSIHSCANHGLKMTSKQRCRQHYYKQTYTERPRSYTDIFGGNSSGGKMQHFNKSYDNY